MDFSSKDENINWSIKNNSNNNPFLLKKMLKSNMANKNKNKFNISNKKFPKTKLTNKSDYISKLDINFDKNSFYSNNNGFANELLVKVMNNNNDSKKIILKDILKRFK